MDHRRRRVLHAGTQAGVLAALAALGLLPPGLSHAQQQAIDAAFKARGAAEGLKAMGAASPVESKDVVITAPDIAENGAVVPVSVRSAVPKTDLIALLVDKNPNALAGAYELLAGAAPDVAMRIKMGQSSDVIALVRAEGKWYTAKKDIKVTLGGCGG